MAATTNGQIKKNTVVDSLRKADERWARRTNDQPAPTEYLEHLACSLPAAAVASNSNTAPSNADAETSRLREQVVAAENNAAARRAELDQARAELTDAKAEIEKLRAAAAGPRPPTVTARKDDAELEQLRARVTELEAVEADSKKLIGELRSDYDAAVDDTQKVADQLSLVSAERDRLAERLGAATSHRCTWQWHGPEEPVKPCTCGRPVPRYEIQEIS